MILRYHRSCAVLLTLLLSQSCLPAALAVEPITTGIAVGAAAIISGFLAGHEYFKCKWYECCSADWVQMNNTGKLLRAVLQRRLYGQHLVIDTISKAVESHIKNPTPSKALVMSFHGWTGGGKNYVSQMLAETLYTKGTKSSFYHLFSATLHFPHISESQTYRDQISHWIRGNVTRCERSLFIFDETDKMPEGVLDALKPFIDVVPHIQGVDFRKSIFIFLSNTGGTDISTKTHDHWAKGRKREDIQLKDMEGLINTAAFNEKGGLQFLRLIANQLIDHFVPFLPLEKDHVRLCIRDYYEGRRNRLPTEEQIQSVLKSLQWYPAESRIYSASGCKRVAQKVELELHEEEEEEFDWDTKKTTTPKEL